MCHSIRCAAINPTPSDRTHSVTYPADCWRGGEAIVTSLLSLLEGCSCNGHAGVGFLRYIFLVPLQPVGGSKLPFCVDAGEFAQLPPVFDTILLSG